MAALWRMPFVVLGVLGTALGCGASTAPTNTNMPKPPVPKATPAWAEATRSPWPIDDDGDARADALAGVCEERDGALTRIARRIASDRARGLGVPEGDDVVRAMRSSGEPHVRPRLFLASGRHPLDVDALRPKMNSAMRHAKHPRCGVAISQTPDGGEVAVAVIVDALADLAEVPLRARSGQWLTFEARMRVDAKAAKVVVLGPRGTPRTVPTTFASPGVVRARFALDTRGPFTVQLVGDLEGGPQPLLEAKVFADVEPSTPGETEAAPGEEEATDAQDGGSLLRMLNGLRASEGVPVLTRDRALDELAQSHAARMEKAGQAVHDLGDGDFRARFEEEGLSAKAVGENVAHARDVKLAHRALHASPSHRTNLLRADYTHTGIGVAIAPDGSVFVCEVFAARGRRPR